jgi:molybdopterin converting factor small subunit
MNLTVLYFGAAADAAEVHSETLSIENAVDVGHVVESLKAAHPGLRAVNLLTALNEEYVQAGAAVSDGDTIALFTPVSGG